RIAGQAAGSAPGPDSALRADDGAIPQARAPARRSAGSAGDDHLRLGRYHGAAIPAGFSDQFFHARRLAGQADQRAGDRVERAAPGENETPGPDPLAADPDKDDRLNLQTLPSPTPPDDPDAKPKSA